MGNEHSENTAADTLRKKSNKAESSVDDTGSIYISTLEFESFSPTNLSSTKFNTSSLALPTINDASPMPASSPAPTTLSNRSGRRGIKSAHRRRSSLLNVHNGITGKYISSRICKIAANFWKSNIETMSVSEQLEIGCSVFFGMMAANPDMKSILKSRTDKSIENTSLRYLDMFGWLIRHLIADSIDLYALLTRLGTYHRNIGISIKYFTPMLSSMHETFSYYFETKYNIEIQYAVDEIFSLATQIMTGQELKRQLKHEFQSGMEVPFLATLDACLASEIGSEYLYRFLAQTWCDEMAIFLKSVARFKRLMSDKERFMVAREITKISIEPTATFSLNLAYETRQPALRQMKEFEKMFAAMEQFEVATDLYSQIEREVYTLIRRNHWQRFTESIEALQIKSFSVE